MINADEAKAMTEKGIAQWFVQMMTNIDRNIREAAMDGAKELNVVTERGVDRVIKELEKHGYTVTRVQNLETGTYLKITW